VFAVRIYKMEIKSVLLKITEIMPMQEAM
jgi:hypothetical protein